MLKSSGVESAKQSPRGSSAHGTISITVYKYQSGWPIISRTLPCLLYKFLHTLLYTVLYTVHFTLHYSVQHYVQRHQSGWPILLETKPYLHVEYSLQGACGREVCVFREDACSNSYWDACVQFSVYYSIQYSVQYSAKNGVNYNAHYIV